MKKSVKSLIALSAVLLFFACSRNKSSISKLESSFKYQDLKSLEFDSIEWKDYPKIYSRLDTSLYSVITRAYENSYVRFVDENEYLFSWQKNNRGFDEIVILRSDEGWPYLTLTYYIFDLEGKELGKFIAAVGTADGGEMVESRSVQIDDNVWQKTQVSDLFKSLKSESMDTLFRDSSIINYTIQPNGEILKQLIFRKTYVSPYAKEFLPGIDLTEEEQKVRLKKMESSPPDLSL